MDESLERVESHIQGEQRGRAVVGMGLRCETPLLFAVLAATCLAGEDISWCAVHSIQPLPCGHPPRALADP